MLTDAQFRKVKPADRPLKLGDGRGLSPLRHAGRRYAVALPVPGGGLHLEGLTFGHNGIPEFAGTKQRVPEVLIENEDPKEVAFLAK